MYILSRTFHTFLYCLYIVSPLPSAHQTNITFRSNSWGVGRGFFVLAVRTLLACSTCGPRGDGRRTTLPLAPVPPQRGCSIGINPKGVDGLRGPPGRNSRAASRCVSCLPYPMNTTQHSNALRRHTL